jgi:hypothetical protein
MACYTLLDFTGIEEEIIGELAPRVVTPCFQLAVLATRSNHKFQPGACAKQKLLQVV